MEDRCVMCGRIIPEGRQICPICEKGEPMDTKEKLIELCEKALNYAGTGREMRFTGGDVTPCLIANGVTVQEWISVKDRLPEESGEYLAYCGEYDGICVLYYEVLKTKGKWRTKWKDDVTHWMPLPEPPKGE